MNTLNFDYVVLAQPNELLNLLIAGGLINGYSDANAICIGVLPGKGVDLTGLRPDGVMNALGNAKTTF